VGERDESAAPDRTADGHHIIVNGRKWRATNPQIPAKLRTELIGELMAGRRAVKAAKGHDTATTIARTRVHNAKIALGERGQPWWEEPSEEGLAQRVEATILALLSARGPEKTICPSDVARIVASPSWRASLPQVRAIAEDLTRGGVIVITQRGELIEHGETVKGPVRYAMPDPNT